MLQVTAVIVNESNVINVFLPADNLLDKTLYHMSPFVPGRHYVSLIVTPAGTLSSLPILIKVLLLESPFLINLNRHPLDWLRW